MGIIDRVFERLSCRDYYERKRKRLFYLFTCVSLFLRVDRQAYGFVYIEIISTNAIGLTRFWLLCISYVFLFSSTLLFPFCSPHAKALKYGMHEVRNVFVLNWELGNDEFLIIREDGVD